MIQNVVAQSGLDGLIRDNLISLVTLALFQARMILNHFGLIAPHIFPRILEELFSLCVERDLWRSLLVIGTAAGILRGPLSLEHMLFVELNVFLNLVEACEAALLKLSQLADDLSQLLFFHQVVY